MQQHGARRPGTSFSHNHLLGRSSCPSKLPGGVSPLIPVLRKTIHLDAFSQSHIPQAPSRPSLGARARSVPPQEAANSAVPRKLSSISLTLRQNSLGPLPSHWEEAPALGREAAIHGRGKLPIPDSPPVTLVPGGRVHPEGPGNPGLAKPSRMPGVERRLVSSYLALPFQSRLAQLPPGPAGPGSVGQKHPVPVTAHVPTGASPGRGKSRFRGIPRARLHLQRATPTTGPVMAMDLVTLDTTRPVTARHLATMATNRPSLAAPKTSRLDIGAAFPALDTKLGTATDWATAGPAKRDLVKDLVASDPHKLGKAIAIVGTAGPDTTTAVPAGDVAAPDPAKPGTVRPDTAQALVRVNPARLDMAMDPLALDTSGLGTVMGSAVPLTLNPATGETTLDGVINLTTSDIATHPLMSSRSRAPAPDYSTAGAAADLAGESKGKCKELGWACAGLLLGDGPGGALYMDRLERKQG